LTIISIHFPSAQNWTFAGPSGNYCVRRGVSVIGRYECTYFRNGGHCTMA